MNKDPMNIFLMPIDLAWRNVDENIEKMNEALKKTLLEDPVASAKYPRICVFPELTLSSFSIENAGSIAMGREDPAIIRVMEMAQEYRTAIVFGFPEKNPEDPNKPFNLLAFVSDRGEWLGSYRKMHLFTIGSPAEADGFARGNSGTVVKFHNWTIGLSTCFDLRFPSLYHAYAKRGIDLMINSSCWVGGPTKSQQFKALVTGHAVAGQYFTVAVNRSGRDPNFYYEGETVSCTPFGEMKESAQITLDPRLVEQARRMSVRSQDLTEYRLRERKSDGRSEMNP
jgi:predicted amidohydrolase